MKHPSEADTIPSGELLASLQVRANLLLAGLTAFQDLLRQKSKDTETDIRKFKSTVQTECSTLEKFSKQHPSGRGEDGRARLLTDQGNEDDHERNRLHFLRSSNLPFYESVWRTAKQCRGVKALGKRVYYSQKEHGGGYRPGSVFGGAVESTRDPKPNKKHVIVDIIAEDGLEWVKVSTMTEKRLLFEMAKEGWEGYGDESDPGSLFGGEGDGSSTTDQKSAPGLELKRLARDLKTAAQQTRVRYRHPRIRFVLPKIIESNVKEIEAVISDLRATGIAVDCASQAQHEVSSQLSKMSPAGSLCSSSFDLMLQSPHAELMSTLNIDCTILLALISDISHLPRDLLPPSPNPHSGGTYHSAILHQIEAEEKTPLLPTELYPILAGRDKELVCTTHAARRMREIVDTMGTPGERERANIVLGENNHRHYRPDDAADLLRHAMAKQSSHPIPVDLNLPIRVVPFDPEVALTLPTPPTTCRPRGIPPSIARRLVDTVQMSEINRSVFLFGWSRGITTVTSNRAVAAGVERCLNAILDEIEAEVVVVADDDDGEKGTTRRKKKVREYRGEEEHAIEMLSNFQGPKIWICDTARSLVGKDKHRREG